MAASFEVGGPPGKRMSFAVTVLVAFLLAMQPDFGQASLIIASWLIMYFVAGAPMTLLAGMASAVAGAGVLAYNSWAHPPRNT